MNDLQKLLVDLSEQKEKLKEGMLNIDTQLNKVLLELGVGNFFKDNNTGLVYKVVEPTGTYIEYRKIGYVRTKKDGETKGSLSKKEADELMGVLSK